MSVSVLAHSKTGGDLDGGKVTHDETNVSGTQRVLTVIEILRKRFTGGACMLQVRKTMVDRHDERAIGNNDNYYYYNSNNNRSGPASAAFIVASPPSPAPSLKRRRQFDYDSSSSDCEADDEDGSSCDSDSESDSSDLEDEDKENVAPPRKRLCSGLEGHPRLYAAILSVTSGRSSRSSWTSDGASTCSLLTPPDSPRFVYHPLEIVRSPLLVIDCPCRCGLLSDYEYFCPSDQSQRLLGRRFAR